MAKQHDLVVEIMTSNCIKVLDGKKFGTALGEILKMLRVAEEELLHENDLFIAARQRAEAAESELRVVRAELDMRTPHGLREALHERISSVMTSPITGEK